MATLKEMADAAKSWATQEASDIASGAKTIPERDISRTTSAVVKKQPTTFPGRMLRKAQSIGLTNRDPGREAAGLTRAGVGSTKTKFDEPVKPYVKENAMPNDINWKSDPPTQTLAGGDGMLKNPYKNPTFAGGRYNAKATRESFSGAADLGEKQPGATLGQAARARGIARAQMNQSSSVGHEAPVKTDLHAGGKPWTPQAKFGGAQATDTGAKAGAFGFSNEGTRQPKDLGRVTAKVLRGQYGEVSPKTAASVKGSFMSQASDDTRWSKEALSLANKAAARSGGGRSEELSEVGETQHEINKSKKAMKGFNIVPEGF